MISVTALSIGTRLMTQWRGWRSRYLKVLMTLGCTYSEHDRAYQHYFCPRLLCLASWSKTLATFIWFHCGLKKIFFSFITCATFVHQSYLKVLIVVDSRCEKLFVHMPCANYASCLITWVAKAFHCMWQYLLSSLSSSSWNLDKAPVNYARLIYLAHHCYDWHPGSRCG